MQRIVLFIEPTDDAFHTPLKIGNLFMNRFAVDEDAAFEILEIFELEKSSFEWPEDEDRDGDEDDGEDLDVDEDVRRRIRRISEIRGRIRRIRGQIPEQLDFPLEREQKGKDLNNRIICFNCFTIMNKNEISRR